MAVQLTRRLFTVEEFHRMGGAGILREDDRVELLEGEIIYMSPIGVRHANCVRRLNHLFSLKLGDKVIVDVQNPVMIGEHSEPQPDVMLLKPKPDFYASSHPAPEDVLLLVEVGDASAEYDRQVKLPLYARNGVQEVWVVDLVAEKIEIYRKPQAGVYQNTQVVSRGQSLSPLAFPDFQLDPAAVLG